MKILFTGQSDFSYNRVKVLREGLKEIEDCEVLDYPIITRKSFDVKAFQTIQDRADCIYIPPFRHIDVRYLSRYTTKPIIFDPLISKLLTKAVDYKQFWKAPIKYVLDKVPFSIAHILIADTLAHKSYFVSRFGIDSDKVEVIPVGVDTKRFYPIKRTKEDSKFIVGCFGSFVPLQGMPILIKVAHLLRDHQDIEFRFIGEGHDFHSVKQYADRNHLSNVKFLGWIDYHNLNVELNQFDICMGIFGNSKKADIVIPNKVYQYAALQKCIITKDTAGIREVFHNNQDILLCTNNPTDIRETILRAKNDFSLRNKIAHNAHALITSQYDSKSIAQQFIKKISRHL